MSIDRQFSDGVSSPFVGRETEIDRRGGFGRVGKANTWERLNISERSFSILGLLFTLLTGFNVSFAVAKQNKSICKKYLLKKSSAELHAHCHV